MTDAEQSDVRVALATDAGDGVRFYADVTSMLEELARRAGVRFELLEECGINGLPVRLYRCSGPLPDRLLREVGIHRGQLVPAGGNGRVMTSRVAVEVPSSPSASAEPGVRKTYNYVYARVTRHDTGERLSLQDVLAGRV